jgi:hypothetical protein
MVVIESVMLHRRDDDSNEFREVILCQDMPVQAHWAVREAVGFLPIQTLGRALKCNTR